MRELFQRDWEFTTSKLSRALSRPEKAVVTESSVDTPHKIHRLKPAPLEFRFDRKIRIAPREWFWLLWSGRGGNWQWQCFPIRYHSRFPCWRRDGGFRLSLRVTREWTACLSMASARRESTAGLPARRGGRTQSRSSSLLNPRAAEQAGFRACRRCRPHEARGNPQVISDSARLPRN